MNELQTVIRWVRKFVDDPLAQVFICTMETSLGTIRWNGGVVQTMKKGEKSFSFGVTAQEWLKEYGYDLPLDQDAEKFGIDK